jgi:hypothetical protein
MNLVTMRWMVQVNGNSKTVDLDVCNDSPTHFAPPSGRPEFMRDSFDEPKELSVSSQPSKSWLNDILCDVEQSCVPSLKPKLIADGRLPNLTRILVHALHRLKRLEFKRTETFAHVK